MRFQSVAAELCRAAGGERAAHTLHGTPLTFSAAWAALLCFGLAARVIPACKGISAVDPDQLLRVGVCRPAPTQVSTRRLLPVCRAGSAGGAAAA